MAQTRQALFDMGRTAGEIGVKDNPYKPGSWQHTAWADGNKTGKAALDVSVSARKTATLSGDGAKLLADLGVGDLPPFPAGMPSPTREHIARLNYMAAGTHCSTRALRLNDKINALYSRWA